MVRTKAKMLVVSVALLVLTICMSVPVMAADKTPAVPGAFASSQYSVLNPGVAAQSGGDINKMYQHYLTEGVREGERIYATPAPTTVEKLFLFMSYNRNDYLNKGLSPTFPYFDLNNYIAQNPGLIAMYGTNGDMYLYHYVNFGVYEGKASGSLLDPAKVIAWNSGIAGLDNPRLDPSKIMSNYTATTGQLTTTALTNPPKAAAPAPARCRSRL